MRTRLITAAALSCLLLLAPAASASSNPADVQRGLEALVRAPGGPPGAIATLYRDGKLTVLRAGRSRVERAVAPRASDHMRIASVAKAFNGALALNLVRAGRLGLDDTVGERLRGLPAAWSAVTVRQMLGHTSGLPDYTRSEAFVEQATERPGQVVSPRTIVGWVAGQPLMFAPGSKYEYSNTDNIVVGMIVQQLTGQSYAAALRSRVLGPAGLGDTTLPIRRLTLPSPFIAGYVTAPGERPVDVTTSISPSGAWASGGIVSTPRDLNAFIRADLGLRFFDRAQQRQQMRFWKGGESSPPGPGRNSAGLALFRYQTRCGTVYGHTGNFPGYVQFAAATADGSRALTTSLNIPAPTGKLLQQLRNLQSTAVCALLGR